MTNVSPENFTGVWSATPTPFADDWSIDTAAVERLVAHHRRLGVRGLFLAGTCGEGAWMPDADRHEFVRAVVKANQGQMALAVQVTDNSSARILDNMRAAQDDGAQVAVIAPPYFLMNATPDNLRRLYLEAIEKSPLSVGVYDRGSNGSVIIPDEVLADLYAADNVVVVKDSSANPQRREIALAAREKRPALRLLNGDEFDCVEYLKAGYDGLMLGGSVFHGYVANQLFEAIKAGDIEKAEECQRRMTRMMMAVYGENIGCWLSGLKQLLVELEVFSTTKNYLHFPLTEQCRADIREVVENDRDVLLP